MRCLSASFVFSRGRAQDFDGKWSAPELPMSPAMAFSAFAGGKAPDAEVKAWTDEGWTDADTADAGRIDFKTDIGYNQYTKQELEGAYQRAVEKGDISPFITFDQYESTAGQIEHKIVGVTLPSGDMVEGYSQHFIDRVIGQHSADDLGRPGMRRGVSVEDVLDAIENPVKITEIVTNEKGLKSYLIIGGNCKISINPDSNTVIQVSPR